MYDYFNDEYYLKAIILNNLKNILKSLMQLIVPFH